MNVGRHIISHWTLFFKYISSSACISTLDNPLKLAAKEYIYKDFPIIIFQFFWMMIFQHLKLMEFRCHSLCAKSWLLLSSNRPLCLIILYFSTNQWFFMISILLRCTRNNMTGVTWKAKTFALVRNSIFKWRYIIITPGP